MLPRLTGISDSGFRCYRYSPVPNFVQLSVFGLWSLAFQPGCWALIVRFSLVGVGRSFLRLRGGLLWSIVRITADREWIVNMADGWEENQTITFTSNQYGTVFLPIHRKLYPALSPRRRRMLPQPLANDLRRERIAHIGKQSDLHKLYPYPIPS